LTLLVGRQEGHLACKKLEWWGAGMVICLERVADMHMSQLKPLPLTVASVKSRLVLPFWYQLTRVVLEKGPLNGCVRVCVCVGCLVKQVCFFGRRFNGVLAFRKDFLHSYSTQFLLRDCILARYMLLSCIRLSVASRYCVKTAKHRISQTTPHDSPGNLVF